MFLKNNSNTNIFLLGSTSGGWEDPVSLGNIEPINPTPAAAGSTFVPFISGLYLSPEQGSVCGEVFSSSFWIKGSANSTLFFRSNPTPGVPATPAAPGPPSAPGTTGEYPGGLPRGEPLAGYG